MHDRTSVPVCHLTPNRLSWYRGGSLSNRRTILQQIEQGIDEVLVSVLKDGADDEGIKTRGTPSVELPPCPVPNWFEDWSTSKVLGWVGLPCKVCSVTGAGDWVVSGRTDNVDMVLGDLLHKTLTFVLSRTMVLRFSPVSLSGRTSM